MNFYVRNGRQALWNNADSLWNFGTPTFRVRTQSINPPPSPPPPHATLLEFKLKRVERMALRFIFSRYRSLNWPSHLYFRARLPLLHVRRCNQRLKLLCMLCNDMLLVYKINIWKRAPLATPEVDIVVLSYRNLSVVKTAFPILFVSYFAGVELLHREDRMCRNVNWICEFLLKLSLSWCILADISVHPFMYWYPVIFMFP